MLKRLLILYLLLFFHFFGAIYTKNISSAVTYSIGNNTRLGDHLRLYSKAKWIAYKYKIPLLYKPFDFSQELTMHTKENLYSLEMEKKFTQIIHLRKYATAQIEPHKGILYIVHLNFIDSEAWSYSYNGMADTFKKNPHFLNNLKAMISPIHKMQNLKIPPNTVSIAVHVRRGGGFDLPLYQNKDSSQPQQAATLEQFADKIWPVKFPPHSFYIEQIKRIAQEYKGIPLYVHIFTDDPNPSNIVDIYQKALAAVFPITFGCRKENNTHTRNVLEDLFAMKNFDFLIRPESGLSLFSQILGTHKLVIYPLHATWQNDATLIIDKIGFTGPLNKSCPQRV